MNFKKITALLLAVLCLFGTLVSAVSCGDDFESEGWYEQTEKTKRAAGYKLLNGHKHYSVDFDEAATVSVTVATASGEINAEIYPKDMPEAPIYSVRIVKNAEGVCTATVNGDAENPITLSGDYTGEVRIATEGSYVIHVSGVNHSGSYAFDW